MSQYQAYDTLLSRKLATTSTNFFDSTSRLAALNQASQEFTDEYNPPELRKKAVLTMARDGIVIHDCDEYNSSAYGTFAAVAGTDADTVATDTSTVRFDDGSVSFNITPGASVNNYAEIEVASLTSLDLSTLLSTGLFRMWVWLPNAVNFTSVSLYIGSSSTDYYLMTATTDINGNALSSDGWVRLEFNWANATTNGSPSSSALDYLKLRFTYSASFTGGTGFRVDDIRIVGAGTPKIDYNYTIATLPSDLTDMGRVTKLVDTSDGSEFIGIDATLYERTSGNYWTIDYSLTHQARRIFVQDGTVTSLLMSYTGNPTTMTTTVTSDNGLNSKSDEVIALYAAEILLTEARDIEAMAIIQQQKRAATMTWHQRYGMANKKRLRSRFEREDFYNRS